MKHSRNEHCKHNWFISNCEIAGFIQLLILQATGGVKLQVVRGTQLLSPLLPVISHIKLTALTDLDQC